MRGFLAPGKEGLTAACSCSTQGGAAKMRGRAQRAVSRSETCAASLTQYRVPARRPAARFETRTRFWFVFARRFREAELLSAKKTAWVWQSFSQVSI